MSEPTMKQLGVRGLIAALDVEHPKPPFDQLAIDHPEGMLNNGDGVPVMPIHRIVEVVLDAVLPDGDLFQWNGKELMKQMFIEEGVLVKVERGAS